MKKEALTEKGKELFPYFKKFKKFYLAGGTGLALQIGHRISVDFDFFTNDFISDSFLKKIEKEFSGKKISISVNNPEELTIFVNRVKVTFLRYPFPLVDELIEYEGVKIMKVKEIAATKAYTIGRRGSYKDYIDLYFCIKERFTNLSEIITIAEKKYGQQFNSRLFLEQLIYLKDIKDIKILFLKKKLRKNALSSFFEKEIKKLKI